MGRGGWVWVRGVLRSGFFLVGSLGVWVGVRGLRGSEVCVWGNGGFCVCGFLGFRVYRWLVCQKQDIMELRREPQRAKRFLVFVRLIIHL